MNFNLKPQFLAGRVEFPPWNSLFIPPGIKEIQEAPSHLGQTRIVWGAVVAKAPWERIPPSSQCGCCRIPWGCAGSPKNELLSGLQVVKFLFLVLSSKTRQCLGKGVIIMELGNGGMVISLFHWSSCLQQGIWFIPLFIHLTSWRSLYNYHDILN